MWFGAGATLRAQVQPLTALGMVTISNGDFSSPDLSGTGWVTQGSVFAPAGVASLGDDTAARTFLYQLVPVSGGTYSLSFDIKPETSPNIPPGNFADTFFSTIYFTDTPGAFNLTANTGYSGLQQVVDIDASGVVNQGSGVSFAASPGMPGFTRYTALFSTSAAYIVPVFELFDLNGIPADSLGRIDNVAGSLSVPEPSRALLMAAGCAAAILARRRPFGPFRCGISHEWMSLHPTMKRQITKSLRFILSFVSLALALMSQSLSAKE